MTKYLFNIWNKTKYTIISTIIIVLLAFFIWYICSKDKKENFEQNWTKSIKCLGLNNEEIILFHSYLSNTLNGEDPNKNFNNLIKMLEKKGLDYNEIIKCLISKDATNPTEDATNSTEDATNSTEEFQPNNPYYQHYEKLK